MQNPTEEPLSQVQLELRPHVHLVSSFKCESRGDPFNFDPKQITELLKSAAAETKGNNESWCWKMLEAPRDRTALIIWQSSQQIGRQFPSDGYVWADPEETSIEQVDNYKLECFKHKVGYVPALEQYTLHARSRYRLIPMNSNQGSQSCDASLWLVLYYRADRSRVLHVRRIPPGNIHTQKPILEQRKMILQNGTPKTKDFIWEDRSHWPDLRFPQNLSTHRPYGPNVIARSQQGPYLAGQQIIDQRTGQPATKRMKQAASFPAYIVPEGEDDGGNGDLMDFLTPRDISRVRFKQHSEWMEELYASPYSVEQIHPVSIGLGRAGELAALSHGMNSIDTPLSIDRAAPAKRIDAVQFDAYLKNADEKIAAIRAEISRETNLHAKRVAQIQRQSIIQEAEKKLRVAVQFSNTDSPVLQSSDREAPDRASTQKDAEAASVRQVSEIERVVQDVQSKMKRHVKEVRLAILVDKGGLEEKAPTPVAPADIMMNDSDELLQITSPKTTANENLNHESSPPARSFPTAADNPRKIDQTDEDYVMVDKDQQPDEQSSETPDINADEQGTGDDMGGDDFLNFDGDANGDNFDSMFTDVMGAGTDIETPGDGALEALHTDMERASSVATPNAVDTLSGQPDQ